MRTPTKIWIISEVFYPDEDGTSYYMTRLAEYFAEFCGVAAICGQPKYTARGSAVAKKEIWHGVQIDRAFDIALNKNVLLFRFLNALFVSFSMFFKMIINFRPGDVAFVVTNPPLMPFLALVACKIRRTRYFLRVDDVYPEAMIAADLFSEQSIVAKTMRLFNGWLYRNVDRVIVLGRDMEKLVQTRMNGKQNHICLIHNWADVATIKPSPRPTNSVLQELGIQHKNVVQCAGNMGRVQAIETMFRAAEILRDDKRIHFLFIGNGAKRKWMEKEVLDKCLNNVTLLEFRPRSEQNTFLNACDISMASLVGGLAGAGVPSRMYNVMAVGKPLIAVADPESELSMVVKEEEIGWVVPPDNPSKLAEVIKEAFSDLDRLASMGRTARRIAEEKYAADLIFAQYSSLIEKSETIQCPQRRTHD